MATTLGTRPTTVHNASEGKKFSADTSLTVVDCPTCGITYAIPASLKSSALKYRADTANGWWLCCPLGHTWGYMGETDVERAERLQMQAERREQATRDLLEHEQRSHAATKGHLTRGKKRAAAAMCPVPGCHRHFVNMERHLSTKHPNFTPPQKKA